MAASRLCEEATQKLPTHALVHFDVDNTVCGLAVKRIVHPPLLQLAVGCTCTVRWSGRKQYDATVLFIGDASSVAKEECDWATSHQDDNSSDQEMEETVSDKLCHKTKADQKSRRRTKKRKRKDDKVKPVKKTKDTFQVVCQSSPPPCEPVSSGSDGSKRTGTVLQEAEENPLCSPSAKTDVSSETDGEGEITVDCNKTVMTIHVSDDDDDDNDGDREREIATPTHFITGKDCGCTQKVLELMQEVKSIKSIVTEIREFLCNQTSPPLPPPLQLPLVPRYSVSSTPPCPSSSLSLHQPPTTSHCPPLNRVTLSPHPLISSSTLLQPINPQLNPALPCPVSVHPVTLFPPPPFQPPTSFDPTPPSLHPISTSHLSLTRLSSPHSLFQPPTSVDPVPPSPHLPHSFTPLSLHPPQSPDPLSHHCPHSPCPSPRHPPHSPCPSPPHPPHSLPISFHPAISPPILPPVLTPPLQLSSPHLAGIVNAVRLQSCSRSNFCANMVRKLYTTDERMSSNVRGKLGKNQLDATRMTVIRQSALQVYPLGTGEKEDTVWRLCIKAIDESCRRLNRHKA